MDSNFMLQPKVQLQLFQLFYLTKMPTLTVPPFLWGQKANSNCAKFFNATKRPTLTVPTFLCGEKANCNCVNCFNAAKRQTLTDQTLFKLEFAYFDFAVELFH